MPSKANRIREAKWAAEAVASDEDLDSGLAPAAEQSSPTRPTKVPKSTSNRARASSIQPASSAQSDSAAAKTVQQNNAAQSAKREPKRKAATEEGGTAKRAKPTNTNVIPQGETPAPRLKPGTSSAGESAAASDRLATPGGIKLKFNLPVSSVSDTPTSSSPLTTSGGVKIKLITTADEGLTPRTSSAEEPSTQRTPTRKRKRDEKRDKEGGEAKTSEKDESAAAPRKKRMTRRKRN